MNNKGFFKKYYSLYFLLLASSFVNTILCSFIGLEYFLISALIFVASLFFVIVRVVSFQKFCKDFSEFFRIGSTQGSKLLSNFKISVIYTTENGEILWYNDFFSTVLKGNDCYGMNVYEVLRLNKDKVLSEGKDGISFNGREYTVYSSFADGLNSYGVFYLIDDTNFKKIALEYAETRPVFIMINFDNFREATANIRESEVISLRSAIHNEIEKWLSDVSCLMLQKSATDAFIVVEERSLKKLMDDKFSILESVRNLKLNNVSGVTLSIGVGRSGKTLTENETFCKQALDMAQSRGGDQVAIKSSNNDYKFFGGVSKAVERKTKVRARVVASAIKEMFSSADNIMLMGHKFSDLDSLGSAFALSSFAEFLNKSSYIVIDEEKNLAKPLYERIKNESSCAFLSPEQALEHLGEKTVLVVVDTHRKEIIECSELYEKCANVIVVDHHRKAVDAIDNSVIFYHETATSSTCEMVSEILQYIKGYNPSKLVCEALLSGIILDSKNLCLHTGTRTFEACAYLRSNGADPIAVKKLFSDDISTCSRKARIVSSVKIYKDCAISYDETSDNITRIASSQAADELLNLEGINASFVMSNQGDEINISARSLGGINVQIIMEQLGGGGHQNMAACQLKNSDFSQAHKVLLEAINNYKNNF